MPVVTRFATTHAIVVTGWTNPLNAGADDNVYATSAPAKNATVNGDYGGFDFDTNIPTGSTINSVTATVGWFVSITTSVATLGLQTFVAGVAQGTETTNAAEPTTETTNTHVPTGLTRDNLLDANLKIRVRASRGNNNTAFTASLDYVKVAVDYTGPAQPLTAALTAGAAVTATGLSLLASEYYRFRDQFLTDDAAPLAMPRTAEPGPGVWDGAAGGSDDSIANDRLDLVAAVASTWGANRIVGPSMVRTNGRVFAGVVLLSDPSMKGAIGWYPGDPTGDPTTDGHAWTGYVTGGGETLAITPGGLKTIDAGARNVRPIQYFIATVLTDRGAVHLLSAPRADSGGGMTYPPGIPAYPNAAIYWVETSNGGDEYLRPYVSIDDNPSFSLGMKLSDLRVVDVPSWTANDAIALFKDRFIRGDSTTDPGPLWTAVVGQMGILGNALYYVSGAYGRVKNTNIGMTDGIWTYTVKSGSRADPQAIIDLRYVDDSNFIFFLDYGTTGARLYKKVAGVDTLLQSAAFTWVANTTYRIRVAAYGNKYRVWVDETDVFGSWTEDTGNNFLTATGLAFSLESVAPVGGKITDVATYPATIALPLELRQGAKPANDTGERTINADDYTDTNGTNLEAHTPTGASAGGGAWDDHNLGTWTIQSNAVQPPAWSGADLNYLATQAVAVGDYEAKATVKTKTTIVDATDIIRGGVAVRVSADGQTYIAARCFMHPDQPSSDEIELIAITAGSGSVVRKLNLGNFYQQNTGYVLAVQTKGDLLTVYLDDKPRISYHFDPAVFTGTRAGLYHNRVDTGTTYDLWVAQNLPLSASIAAGAVVTANLSVGAPAHPLTAGLTADAVTTAALTVYHTLTAGLTAGAVVGALGIEVGHAPTAGLTAGAVVGATALVTSHAMTLALTADAVVTASAITEAHAMALGLTADAVVSATRITESHAMALGVTAGGVVTSDLTVGGAAAALTAALTAGAVVGADLAGAVALAATITADAVVTASRLTTTHAMTLAMTADAVVGATRITEVHAMTLGLTAGAVVGASAITESHAMALTLTADAVVGATRITESHAMTLGLTAGGVVGSELTVGGAGAVLTAALTADAVVGALRIMEAHAMALGLTADAVVTATRITESHALALGLTADAIVGAASIRVGHAATATITAGGVVTANFAVTLLGSLTARLEAVPLLSATLAVDPMVSALLEAA